MKSFYRWVSDHSGLCRTALFITLLLFTLYASSFEYISFLSIYLIDLAIWFIVGRFIAAAPGKLMEEPTALCDQECDPYPLLKEMEQMLTRRLNGPQQQLAQINYAMALRMVGENYKAAEILEKINIDRHPGFSPYSKFVYYNNLSDALFSLGRDQEALIWYRKSRQIFDDLPEGKFKQQLFATAQLSQAEVLYREGEHIQALRQAAGIKCTTKRQLLDTALLAAKCHISLEEPEKAREKLNYIVEHGNKLHIVEEAKVLLETLN